jgi:hypothetical protein
MLATLLLSSGIPMLLGGDEIGRTQQGNNNAYCQDNEISWFDWSGADTDLLAFTKRLIALRSHHPVFRRRRFLTGSDASELGWFTPAGTAMTGADWNDASALAVTVYLDGSDSPDRAVDGSLLIDDDFLILVNAWWEPLTFTIPVTRPPQDAAQRTWLPELDTHTGTTGAIGTTDDPDTADNSPDSSGTPSVTSISGTIDDSGTTSASGITGDTDPFGTSSPTGQPAGAGAAGGANAGAGAVHSGDQLTAAPRSVTVLRAPRA